MHSPSHAAPSHQKRVRRAQRSPSLSWPGLWDYIDMPTTEHAAAKLVAECGSRLDRMLTGLDKARKKGGIAVQRDLQKRLLRSGSARIAAMARSVKREGWKWSAS